MGIGGFGLNRFAVVAGFGPLQLTARCECSDLGPGLWMAPAMMTSLPVQRLALGRSTVMTPLRQCMLEDMQIRNFSRNTQEPYLQQVSLFARHFRRSPEGLGPADIRAYQLYLTKEKKLATSSIQIATCALRFLCSVTMNRPWDVQEFLSILKNHCTLNRLLDRVSK